MAVFISYAAMNIPVFKGTKLKEPEVELPFRWFKIKIFDFYKFRNIKQPYRVFCGKDEYMTEFDECIYLWS